MQGLYIFTTIVGIIICLITIIIKKIEEYNANKPENFTKDINNTNLPNIKGYIIYGFNDIPYKTSMMLINKDSKLKFYFKINNVIVTKELDLSLITNIKSEKSIGISKTKGFYYSNEAVRINGIISGDPVLATMSDTEIPPKTKFKTILETTITYKDKNEMKKILITNNKDISFLFSQDIK